VIPERIIFVSRGITVHVFLRYVISSRSPPPPPQFSLKHPLNNRSVCLVCDTVRLTARTRSPAARQKVARNLTIQFKHCPFRQTPTLTKCSPSHVFQRQLSTHSSPDASFPYTPSIANYQLAHKEITKCACWRPHCKVSDIHRLPTFRNPHFTPFPTAELVSKYSI
jgi:hypothetical protein